MLSIFCHDGYTLTGKIPGLPGVYPAVTVRYRPIAPEDRWRYTSCRADEQFDVAAKLILERVIDVAPVKPDGDDDAAVKLDDKSVRQLHAGIFTGLFNLALGFVGADVEKMEANLKKRGEAVAGAPERGGPAVPAV